MRELGESKAKKALILKKSNTMFSHKFKYKFLATLSSVIIVKTGSTSNSKRNSIGTDPNKCFQNYNFFRVILDMGQV